MDQMFLTVLQFAEKMKVSPQTVRSWLRSGRIKGMRLNGNSESHWRIPSAELMRLHAEIYEETER